MVTAECVSCSACEFECPVRAITQRASQYVIDPTTCVECEGYFPVPRCTWVCPVGACVPERSSYLARAASIAARGFPPLVVTRSAPAGRTVPIELVT
jgi:ferredoxin